MSSDVTVKTAFTTTLAEALAKEEDIPVMIRAKDGTLRTLQEATVTRIMGPDGVEQRVMVLSEGEGDQDEAPPAEELN